VDHSRADDAAARRIIIRDAVSIALATGAYGLSFGAVSVLAGLSVLETCALSLLMFTGASQFALVSIVESGGTAFAAAATAILVGSRNALYGLRLSRLLQVGGVKRLVAAHWVLDESTAMAIAQPTDRAARLGFYATGGAIFVCWNIATLLGAVGANALADPTVLGLDVAGPAAFVALLAPQLRNRETWAVAVAAGVVALVMTPLAPVGIPVLCAAAVAVVVGMVRRG
jgi:predicted branched-subunit amino acid permease